MTSSTKSNELIWEKTFNQSGIYQLFYETINTAQPITTKVTVKVFPDQLATLQLVLSLLTDSAEVSAIKLAQPYQLVSGLSYQLKTVGKDIFGNIIHVQPSWKLVGDIGRIRSTEDFAILDATFIGSGHLVATSFGVSTRKSIKIYPYQKEISSNGGQVKSPVGIRLNIPSKTFSQNVNIAVQIIEPPGMEEKAKRITPVIKISPLQPLAKRPIQLIFDYRSAITSDFEPSELSLYFWDSFSKNWMAIASRVDTTNFLVETTINHFGIFALMASDEPNIISPELTIQNIQFSPSLFFAPENHQLTITYQIIAPIDQQANSVEVTMKIFNLYNQEVTILLDQFPRRIGNNVEVWSGRDMNGQIVPNGRYILLVLVDDGHTQAYEKQIITVFK